MVLSVWQQSWFWIAGVCLVAGLCAGGACDLQFASGWAQGESDRAFPDPERVYRRREDLPPSTVEPSRVDDSSANSVEIAAIPIEPADPLDDASSPPPLIRTGFESPGSSDRIVTIQLSQRIEPVSDPNAEHPPNGIE